MNMKSSVYPAVMVASLLGLVGLVLLWLQFNVSIETINSEAPSLPPVQPQPKPSSQPLSTIPAQPTLAPKLAEPVKQDTRQVSISKTAGRGTLLGALRLSNQTDQPVRVALMARQVSSTGQPAYNDPAHWDFAPGEGSRQGLLLSLPESNLKLKEGDILVAFAQDGSRRYWGPYVVGETAAPTWNRQTSEWQMILQP